MEYIIAPMDRGHIPQIAALERECFSTPWSENMLSDALFDPKASFIVAEDGEGGVLGYAGLQVVLDEGYIDNIAVEEAARRHGVGDALLDVFCRFGQAHLSFLTLEVRASNAPAIALYEKLGFRVVPGSGETRRDIIQAVELGSREAMVAFCKGIQSAAPVDSYVTPEPWAMPGYESEVIMAAGAFVQGASIELSADGPIRPPYAVYFQGGLTWFHAKLGILMSLQKLVEAGIVRLPA